MVTTSEKIILEVGDKKREVLIFRPLVFKPNRPLVIGFGGHGQSDKEFSDNNIHGFWNDGEEENNAIVVYPQPLLTEGRHDGNDGIKYGWQQKIGASNEGMQDWDLKFFKVLLDYFIEHDKIDKDNIFPFGWSNGGMWLSNVLWATYPTLFKCVTTISCMMKTNSDKQPTRYIHAAGTKDTVVPYSKQWACFNKKIKPLNQCTKPSQVVQWVEHFNVVANQYPSDSHTSTYFISYDWVHFPPGEVIQVCVNLMKSMVKKSH